MVLLLVGLILLAAIGLMTKMFGGTALKDIFIYSVFRGGLTNAFTGLFKLFAVCLGLVILGIVVIAVMALFANHNS